MYHLKTEQGIALVFDIAIQNWSTGGNSAFINEVSIITNELEKLLKISDRVVQKSNKDFQDDVKSRKYTIVNGTGTVHGIDYDLSDASYDILDRIWYE